MGTDWSSRPARLLRTGRDTPVDLRAEEGEDAIADSAPGQELVFDRLTVRLKSRGQEEYVEAIESFRATLIQRPGHAEAYFKMGVAYARLGRNADAVAAWEAAARLDPDGEYGKAARESAARLRGHRAPIPES